MKPLTVAVLAISVIVLLLHDVDARGRGGGGRGGSSRGSSRGGWSSGSKGSRGSSRTSSSRRGGSSLKLKITKTTPIKPVKFSTPVIKSQAIRGSRTILFTRIAAGFLVTRYVLAKAPVYWKGFAVYGRYISIPEERAVRLSSERVSLLDSNGHLCLRNSSTPPTLKDGLEKNLLELNTTVIYKTNPEKVTILYGVNYTLISLEDIKEKDFTVTTRARYNVTVAQNGSCTQVEKQVNGTMIQLYEFNPNKANIAGINFKLIVTLIMLMGLLNEHYSL